MKLVIKTKRHFGDRNIHKQGVQFEAYFIHAPTDTAEEFKAMHELSNIVRADCKEAGWYYGFGKYADVEVKNGRYSGGGVRRYTAHTSRACVQGAYGVGRKSCEGVQAAD